jgi:integrase|nr:MAG TPA: site specific tyrosine recombinase [Caudoviricetes sp.]
MMPNGYETENLLRQITELTSMVQSLQTALGEKNKQAGNSASNSTRRTASRKKTNAGSKTVYPIKDPEDIRKLHSYLLEQAHNAPTPHKAFLAYRNWLYFALGINLGLRGGDICELTWDEVVDCSSYDPATRTCSFLDGEYTYLRAEKTGKVTRLVYNSEARKVILDYLNWTGIIPSPGLPVFPSNKTTGTSQANVTGHVDCDNLGRILKQAAIAVGIPYNVCSHTLRKTFGYFLYKATGDLHTLQYIFGHSSEKITLAYIGITDEKIAQAYEQKPDTGLYGESEKQSDGDNCKVVSFPRARDTAFDHSSSIDTMEVKSYSERNFSLVGKQRYTAGHQFAL